MATDGYVVQPLEVDNIGIHSGERYDFLLTADQEEGNFWMKAETFEADRFNSPGVPYIFHDHKADIALLWLRRSRSTAVQQHT